MDLTGKKALITGGNSGIGLATAKLFRASGADVAITGRDPATLAEAQTVLGGDVLVVRNDVGRLPEIMGLMETVGQRFGRLDILCANAGCVQALPFEAVTEAHLDEALAVNFKGVFFAIQYALPILSDGASIIVTTSIANNKGAPGFVAYAAAKAALRSLVRTLSQELAPHRIRVNAVSPGPIDTPGFGRWGVPAETVEAARASFETRSPFGRFGRADEVANAVLFLASDLSGYVTGAELVVDGGFSNLL